MKNVAAAVSGRVQEKCGEPTESPAWDPQRGVFRALPQSRKGFEVDFLQRHVSRNPLTRTPCQVGPQSTKVSIGISCSVMSPETIWPAHPAELGAAKSAARVAKFPSPLLLGSATWIWSAWSWWIDFHEHLFSIMSCLFRKIGIWQWSLRISTDRPATDQNVPCQKIAKRGTEGMPRRVGGSSVKLVYLIYKINSQPFAACRFSIKLKPNLSRM